MLLELSQFYLKYWISCILHFMFSTTQGDYCLVKQHYNTILASLEMQEGSNTPAFLCSVCKKSVLPTSGLCNSWSLFHLKPLLKMFCFDFMYFALAFIHFCCKHVFKSIFLSICNNNRIRDMWYTIMLTLVSEHAKNADIKCIWYNILMSQVILKGVIYFINSLQRAHCQRLSKRLWYYSPVTTAPLLALPLE